MAIRRDDAEQEDEKQSEKQTEKDDREELIKNLKATKQMFFAYVPKGTRGELIVCETKRERDDAAKETKRDIGGGTPVMGTCVGSFRDKVFKLDKEPDDKDKLSDSIKRVVKLATKLNLDPDLQLKSGPIPDEEKA